MIRRVLAGAFVSFTAVVLWTADSRGQQQQPQQPPPPQQQPQQPPTFRTEVDVIRLDVSVLDKNRRPIRGIKPEEFRVFENGKPQRIVAVSEIETVDHDPAPSAWMRNIPRDVATNNLVDQVGDGRVFAIIMDDWNTPWDDVEIIMSARAMARYVIDNRGPSDVAAVIFPHESGKTQDYTSDRMKLLRAIDLFDPKEHPWIYARPQGPGPGGGDMPQRFSPALMRSDCQRSQPTIPTIELVTSQLAVIPNRRKTIILLSTGVPLNFAASKDCPGELVWVMRQAFIKSRESNINIHTIDPAGQGGYEAYLQKPVRRGGRPAYSTVQQPQAEGLARLRRDFLEIVADNTGAHAVTGSESVEGGIDRIFAEDAAYYLLGYQTSNGRPDGKFRKVEVKVDRDDVTVRTRSGYWTTAPGDPRSKQEKEAPGSQDLGLSGLSEGAALPLRASVVPLGLTAVNGKAADVAVVLTMRVPPSIRTVDETVTVVHNVYVNGSPGAPVKQELPLSLHSGTDDVRRYDAFSKLSLSPGRYEIRLNAFNRTIDRSGTVFAEVEVPDFTKSPLTMSGVAIGTKRAAAEDRAGVLSELLPVIPTSERDFAPSDAVCAFFRVFQPGTSAVAPVTLQIMLLDMTNKTVVDRSETLPAEAFGDSRTASHLIDLPLSGLTRGPYVFSVTAKLPSGTSARRDVVFRIR
jgi:VWFA-related protein